MKRSLITLLVATLLAVGSPLLVQAQTLRLGAVLPLSGEAARAGLEQAAALELAVRELGARGVRLELQLLDDRGDPTTAAAHAAQLADAGVHALVCCWNPPTADAVQGALYGSIDRASGGAPPPTLSLSHPTDTRVGEGADTWLFSVAPTPAQVLARLAQEVGGAAQTASLMAPYGPSGDTAEAVLRARLGERLLGSERYAPASSEPLTPEALLAITRLPDVVVVWGERGEEAVAALGARGYTGPLYAEAATLMGLSTLGRSRLFRTLGAGERVRAVVSPFDLGFALPAAHPSAAPGARYRRAAALAGSSSSLAGAYAWDAGLLLGAALEQALAYGLLETQPPQAEAPEAETPEDVQRLRGGLRDVLVGQGPMAGASAVLDAREGTSSAVLSGSLEVAVWQDGVWRPLGGPRGP